MAKMWTVHTGSEHEGDTADHVYESPRDAIKVAKRYASMSAASGEGEPASRMKGGKNVRFYYGGDKEPAVITPTNVRKKNFAFRG